MFNNMRPSSSRALTGALGVLTATAALTAPLPVPSAAASDAPRVSSRAVVVDVEDTNATGAVCLPDEGSYRLRGRLVGPTRVLDGRAGSTRVNVLVHDAGTAGWMWRLPGHPGYDYARRLADHGETSLVLDLLGYGASRLPDARATCLGAQADMLHQVVQHLRSGHYRFADADLAGPPAAAHVVTHGLGQGAGIAQLEAGTFDDVDGLVLMSWTDGGATTLARRTAAQQAASCLGGDERAPLATTAGDYRRLYFDSAPAAVQRAAARRRTQDPCGDVISAPSFSLATRLAAGRVDAPVLLLHGARDALRQADARRSQAQAYPTEVSTRTFAGAGSALPLERPAAKVRRTVLRWLGRLG
jgi:alpha-beta hydrolase superfamily lysophospholipase